MPDWPDPQPARRENTLDQQLLVQIRDLLRSINRKLIVQADEWVLCPDCLGRGERNHPNSRGENYWLPCHRCAKLGRVRKETVDA